MCDEDLGCLIVVDSGVVTNVPVSGDFYFVVSETGVTLSASGAASFQIGDVSLLSLTADGFLSIESDGVVGFLTLTGSASLPDGALFSLSGTYQAEINTTGSAATVSRFTIDDSGAPVLSDGEFVREDISIAANSVRLYMGGSLTVAGQSLVGSFEFQAAANPTDTFAAVNIDATLRWGSP